MSELRQWSKKVLADHIAKRLREGGSPTVDKNSLRFGRKGQFRYEVRGDGVVAVYVARRHPIDRAVCKGVTLAQLKSMAGIGSSKEQAPEETDEVELVSEDMTVAELETFARDHGIDLGDAKLKADMVRVINEALQAE